MTATESHSSTGWRWTEKLSLAVCLSGICIFGLLVVLISAPGTQSFDESVIRQMRAPDDLANPVGPNWLAESMRDWTALGGYSVLLTITILVSVFLFLERQNSHARVILATVVTGFLLTLLLKAIVSRPRPDIVPHYSYVDSPSFPSGHSMMSAIVYLTLGLMLSDLASQRHVKVFLVVAAIAISGTVGFSRIYMGVHYPTDVLAGWWAGTSWALAIWLVLRRRRVQMITTALDRPEATS